jgi:hypothetical protein
MSDSVVTRLRELLKDSQEHDVHHVNLELDLVVAVLETLESRKMAYEDLKEKLDGVKVSTDSNHWHFNELKSDREQVRTSRRVYRLRRLNMTRNRRPGVMLKRRLPDCGSCFLVKRPS